MMTFEANVKHGLPTTDDERLYQAAWLMENGASEGQAAAAVNVKAADVRKYWAKRKADTRSKAVDTNGTIWDANSNRSW
jgi:transposase